MVIIYNHKQLITLLLLICVHMFYSDKTIKLWKVSEKDKKIEGYNTKEDSGIMRDPMNITSLRVCSYIFILCTLCI